MPTFKNIRIPIGKKVKGKTRKTRMQRVQVLKSGKLRFVKNQPRGGGGKRSPAKKPARKRSSSMAKKSNPGNNKSPKIGAAIQAFKGTQAVASPFVEAGLLRGRNTPALVNDLKAKANLDTAGGLVIEGVNQVIDRKAAHGAALSGGSVTAWAAEGFAGLKAFEAAGGKKGKEAARAVNISLSRTIRAYDPQGAGSLDTGDSNFRTYQSIKIGGAVLRRASNKGPFKRIFAPIKKFLGEMGGRL